MARLKDALELIVKDVVVGFKPVHDWFQLSITNQLKLVSIFGY